MLQKKVPVRREIFSGPLWNFFIPLISIERILKTDVMETTTKTRKMSVTMSLLALLLGLSPWLLPEKALRLGLENDLIRTLRQKLSAYQAHFPEDRLYIQTDRPFYEPGDDIWFSAFVRNGQDLKPSGKSDIVCVELLNPKGTVEKKIEIIASHGKAAGDFQIDREAPGGLYKIRAYTNWMKNAGEAYYFTKEIQVQEVLLPALKMKLEFQKKAYGPGDEVTARLELVSNENKPLSATTVSCVVSLDGEQVQQLIQTTDEEGIRYIRFRLPARLKSPDGLLNVMLDYNGNTESITRSIPVTLNAIRLDLFPEGGELLAGQPGRVAFRALNEHGRPADVEGEVLDSRGAKVAVFSSFHQGMGAFQFSPRKGEHYRVRLTRPEGLTDTYKVPDALERGYTLQVDHEDGAEVRVNIATSETEELALVAQIRGEMVYSALVPVKPGTNTAVFSAGKFPAGVLQLTLFDAKGIPRAERLLFVNRDRSQMNISVETDKEKYLPRDKVRMTITVKDEKGLPLPARLSMAVVNDQLLSFADDKSGTILSQLLLQQDLREKVEEPGFYFDKKESRSLRALDYLLMTSGWRRFTWEKLIEEELPRIQFPGQKAVIAGRLLDAQTLRPVRLARISHEGGEAWKTDTTGYFRITQADLSSPLNLSFRADGYLPKSQQFRTYDGDLTLYMYKEGYVPYPRHAVLNMEAGAVLEDRAELAAVAADMVHLKDVKLAEPRPQKQVKLADEKENPGRQAGKPAGLREERADRVLAGRPGGEEPGLRKRRPAPAGQELRPEPGYYRARQYPVPPYEGKQVVELRSDFRNTVYWNPDVEVGYSGRKTLEFYLSDDITSFRAVVEGVSGQGQPGRAEKSFFSQLPFVISTRIPVSVVTEDELSIPLTLKNNTDAPLSGILEVSAPSGLLAKTALQASQTIPPGTGKTIYLDYRVLDKAAEENITIRFTSSGLSDAIVQPVKIVPKGFPAQLSFSSQEKEKEYTFSLDHVVNGSLKLSFSAFPSVVSDLMKGIEGILQEPYGCFEQTSCTAYPNAMVLDYLRNSGNQDDKLMARATDLLDRGYRRLVSFEAPARGYEWFGANPAHEGLTAYGIMEFVDMKKAGQNIDEKMLDRTRQWLLSRRDGKGGFEREKRALHDFGRISQDILNAYIVYALAEADYTDIKKEFEASFSKAVSSRDPYMLAMMANAAFSLRLTGKGNEAMKLLMATQEKDGSFKGLTHSITYSQGASLIIETTALSVLAMLKSPVPDVQAIQKSVRYLVSVRSGSGAFSSTQGTILALKALTGYAKFSKQTTEDGKIAIYIDEKKVAEREYKAGEREEISLTGLEQFVSGEGVHTLKVKYLGVKNPLPYSVAVNWNTFLPLSDTACAVQLSSTLSASSARVGETVRLTARLQNRKTTDLPNTMLMIGLPAGLTPQAWQLKELQERQVFDYYEIKGNTLALYYRGMAPRGLKTIALDLKAEIPGTYEAPAASAYLYYTNELKTWSPTGRIRISPSGN